MTLSYDQKIERFVGKRLAVLKGKDHARQR
jgi:hypothetical protein